MNPQTGALYLAGDGLLTLYDPTTSRTLAQADIGSDSTGIERSYGIAVDSAGQRVYVASNARRAVLALDATTLSLQAVSAGFQQPGGLALLGDRLFAADTLAGTVRVLDAAHLRTLAETEVGPGPYALAAFASTGRVFVALTGSDGVAMLDAAGNRLSVTTLGGLGFPQGLAADEIGSRVYVIYSLSPRYRQIAILDGATGAIDQVIPATLDRPLTGAEALAVAGSPDKPGTRRLLVSAAEGLLAYDLTLGRWEQEPLARGNGLASTFGMAVNELDGTVYLAGPAYRGGGGRGLICGASDVATDGY